ncbi:MAG: protein kinase domain-containing protein [Betaproteobacteria bacterium]
MPLQPGTRLGPYEVLSALGAGGMGEVYRARDTRLNRDVALKILPEAFVSDPERLARFTREAQTLASLNHPNIAHIHGLEESGGVRALVMELVEGEDLSAHIARGALPLAEALSIARQLAEALETAHDLGIIHRDLKPANIKVRDDGTVKVLDFGLAKAVDPRSVSSSAAVLANSPTITSPAAMTGAGVILGTAAYMAPEQAKGKAVDRRADIWAFGCVLYEMLTGRHAFDGETVTDVLAAVVGAEPDWLALPPSTPAAIRDLLHRCLTKEPRRRLRDIGDARIAVEEAQSGAGVGSGFSAAPAETRTSRAAWRRAAPWGLAGLAILAATITMMLYRTATGPAAVMRFTLAPPTSGEFTTGIGSPVVLSPNGTQMVYILRGGERAQLYLRRLDRDQATALPGTEGAFAPFFSPDGQWVAFFAQGKLKKVAVTGGLPVTLCDAADARGGDWGPDDNILFTPTADSPLERVSADGGTPEPVTKLNSAPESDSRSHRWPWFLPGGKQALFNVVYHVGNPLDHSDIGVVSLTTGEYKILIRGGGYPRYVPTGYLVYVVGTDMLAVPFDASKLEVTGTPVVVVSGVRTALYSGSAEFSFSNGGTLAYLSASDRPAPMDRLVWVNRKGVAQPITATLHAYANPRVLPDGRRIVVEARDQQRGIWLYDATRDTLSPLAIASGDTAPALTPDGRNVIYNSVRNGSEGLWMRRVDGNGGEQNFTATTVAQVPNSVSPDGRFVAYSTRTATQDVVLVLSLEGDHKPRPLLPGPGNRAAVAYSPDGRWIAYVSDESGREEVYVAAASGEGGRWPISSGGGAEPLWARGGRELFYRAGSKMMAVEVHSGEVFSTGRAVELFEGDFRHNEGPASLSPDYDVSPDGQRFVMIQSTGPAAAAPAAQGPHMVLNWFHELGGNVGTPP